MPTGGVRAAHRPEERRVDVPVADPLACGGHDGGAGDQDPIRRQSRQRLAAAVRAEHHARSESNPSALKLCSTSRTRSGLVNVTLAIIGTSMPCAESSTIYARRQVTTDPLDRRTMHNSL